MMSTVLRGFVFEHSAPKASLHHPDGVSDCRNCHAPGSMKQHAGGKDWTWRLLACRNCGATYWVARAELEAAEVAA